MQKEKKALKFKIRAAEKQVREIEANLRQADRDLLRTKRQAIRLSNQLGGDDSVIKNLKNDLKDYKEVSLVRSLKATQEATEKYNKINRKITLREGSIAREKAAKNDLKVKIHTLYLKIQNLRKKVAFQKKVIAERHNEMIRNRIELTNVNLRSAIAKRDG